MRAGPSLMTLPLPKLPPPPLWLLLADSPEALLTRREDVLLRHRRWSQRTSPGGAWGQPWHGLGGWRPCAPTSSPCNRRWPPSAPRTRAAHHTRSLRVDERHSPHLAWSADIIGERARIKWETLDALHYDFTFVCPRGAYNASTGDGCDSSTGDGCDQCGTEVAPYAYTDLTLAEIEAGCKCFENKVSFTRTTDGEVLSLHSRGGPQVRIRPRRDPP